MIEIDKLIIGHSGFISAFSDGVNIKFRYDSYNHSYNLFKSLFQIDRMGLYRYSGLRPIMENYIKSLPYSKSLEGVE